MEYISTRNTERFFSFKDVFLKGLAPDGGLFVPKKIPFYSEEDLEKFRNLNYRKLAIKIISDFCSGDFSKSEIEEIVNESYKNFRVGEVVEIKKIEDNNFLELFHGPTLAFKDIAMQVIGNMYEKILKKNNLEVNIIVATSGDTGAAAISALRDRKNIKIFVLHPNNKISDVQRKFMTTINSENVFNVALEGNFDDCQQLVKSMFADKKFNSSINMSGVNSINWSRIVAQTVYYIFSCLKITRTKEKINFSVPTGNFGDIYAGYIAKKMGLPINKLIIATNENDILKRTLNSGNYKPSKVKHTISPSMDIQVASNFERLVFDLTSNDSKKTKKLMDDLRKKGEFKLEDKELKIIRENFCSESLSDRETKLTIREIYKNQKILIDPHTAVGIGVAKKIPLQGQTITLATAHPSKFSEIVKEATGIKPELPENLKDLLDQKEKYEKLPKDLNKIKNFIIERI
ncbi:threonine synthase [Pelagibacteraceae bacterium]|nr:threonine synthase [Pelagibacteraceae bacterium]